MRSLYEGIMFKLNTEKELYNFLKILTEESVKKSRKLLREGDDPYTEEYKSKRKAEKTMFEQDEDAQAEAPGAPEDASATDEEPEAKPPEEEKPAEEESDSSNQESFFASKDRLVDFVNDIRSAPSIKDSAVSDQIDAYYDRLSEEERNVLVFFLREISKVMTGKASGADARDPSDPPLNIDFVPKDKEKETEPSPDAEAPSDETESETGEDTQTASRPDEEEDTSAPIKVNEAQDHSYLRNKIKQLLR